MRAGTLPACLDFLAAMFGDYWLLPPEDQRKGHDLKLGEIVWDTERSYRDYL